MKTFLVILVVLIVGIGSAIGGAYFQPWLVEHGYWGRNLDLFKIWSAPAPTTPIEPQTVVTALGRLEPESEIIEVAAATGIRIESIAAREGDEVRRGDPLAFCDSFEEMTAARDFAKTQLEEARSRDAVETTYGQAAIEEASWHVKQVDEATQYGIEAQRAVERSAEAELDKAQKDIVRSRKLTGVSAMSPSDDEKFTLALRQSEESVSRNKSVLAQLVADRTIQLKLAQSQLEEAQAAQARAHVAASLDSLAANLKLAEARLERTIIRAPIDGQILKVIMHPGETASHDPILKMGDTRTMFATAEVYETDVQRLRPGMRAKIVSRAFSQTLTGRVERIGALVYKNDVLKTDPTADADRRIIEVRIRLDKSDIAARYNHHQVDVAIQLDSLPAMAQIPTTAPIN